MAFSKLCTKLAELIETVGILKEHHILCVVLDMKKFSLDRCRDSSHHNNRLFVRIHNG